MMERYGQFQLQQQKHRGKFSYADLALMLQANLHVVEPQPHGPFCIEST
jgi:hypothetical protein